MLRCLAKPSGGKLVTTWDGESIPVVVGNLNGCDEIQRTCLKEGKQFVYIDHAYVNRGIGMESFRLCVDGFHCSDWRDSDREFKGKVFPWREGQGEHIVVICPARKEWEIFPLDIWFEDVMSRLPRYTDRKIIVKEKGEGDLLQVLQKAWAVVCSGSVADVDAVRRGVPAFCTRYSPVYPVALHDIRQIESPIYPDRSKWLHSLAAAEWRQDEAHEAWERIRPLLCQS